MKRKLLVTLTAIITTVCCAFGISACESSSVPVPSYPEFEEFNEEFAVECFNDGAVPQGLTAYYARYETTGTDGKTTTAYQQYFLISAYMADGSPSRIYVTGQDTGYEGYVTMLNEDGTPHKGSVNGIATNSYRLWVTDGDSILVAQASEEYENDRILSEIVAKAQKNSNLQEGEEEQTIQFTSSFKANCNTEYLYYFHDPRYTTVSYDRFYIGGDRDGASVMYEYRTSVNSANIYGLDLIVSEEESDTVTDSVPKIQKIYYMPENVRGISFSGRDGYGTSSGTLVISQSGEKESHLLCFDWNKLNAKSTKYTDISENNGFIYDGVHITDGTNKSPYTDSDLLVYTVDKTDKTAFTNDYRVPPKSRGMCTITVNGSAHDAQVRVYLLFESGYESVYSFVPKAQ